MNKVTEEEMSGFVKTGFKMYSIYRKVSHSKYKKPKVQKCACGNHTYDEDKICAVCHLFNMNGMKRDIPLKEALNC